MTVPTDAVPPVPAKLKPSIHATAIVLGERGVLVRGRAGAGKSSLGLLLIDWHIQRGRFARLVADDRVHLEVVSRRLLLSAHPAINGRIERRWIGIDTTATVVRCVAHLVIDLDPETASRIPERAPMLVAGVALDALAFPELNAAIAALRNIDCSLPLPGSIEHGEHNANCEQKLHPQD